MIPEHVCGYLVRADPEHAGSAYLKLRSQRGRCTPGAALKFAELDAWNARERCLSELEWPEGVVDSPDLEHEEREARRLEMLREIAVALAAAPARLRRDWERLHAAARALDRGQPNGAYLPPGITKSRAFQVRRQLRRHLGLAE